MTGTLWELALAAAIFPLSHFLLSSTPLRDLLVRALGENGFRGVFSLVALSALIWLIFAYRAAPPGPELWWLFPWGHYLPAVLMPVALFLVIGGLVPTNPTMAGADAQTLDSPRAARGVMRLTRHPVMWGTGLWALSHLPPNGDTASVLFFGSLAVLALAGTLAMDAKYRRRYGARFAPLEMSTSNLPLLAVLQGRQTLAAAAREFGLARLAIVVLAWAALLHGHAWLFGVPPYPVGL